MHSEIETLKTWITESDNIVFFGGAGVSTESGGGRIAGHDRDGGLGRIVAVFHAGGLGPFAGL